MADWGCDGVARGRRGDGRGANKPLSKHVTGAHQRRVRSRRSRRYASRPSLLRGPGNWPMACLISHKTCSLAATRVRWYPGTCYDRASFFPSLTHEAHLISAPQPEPAELTVAAPRGGFRHIGIARHGCTRLHKKLTAWTEMRPYGPGAPLDSVISFHLGCSGTSVDSGLTCQDGRDRGFWAAMLISDKHGRQCPVKVTRRCIVDI